MTRERIKELAKIEEELTKIEELETWFEDNTEWPNKYIRDINGNTKFSNLPKDLQEDIIEAIQREIHLYVARLMRNFSDN